MMVEFIEDRDYRLWVKFTSDPFVSEDPDENGIIGAMSRLCLWGGADQRLTGSNGQVVLSWEFPDPNRKNLDPDGAGRWTEALEALKYYKAQPVIERAERIRFLDGFS